MDFFKHESGMVYPSWQNNKRLLWARRLREMNIGSEIELLPGIRARRVSPARYRLERLGQSAQVFGVNQAESRANDQRIENVIDQVVDWLIEQDEEQNDTMVTETSFQPNEKGLGVLQAIQKAGGSTAGIDGRALRALREHALILPGEEDGKVILSDVALALIGAPVEAPSAPRRVLLEHTPDPTQAPAERPTPSQTAPESLVALNWSDSRITDIAVQVSRQEVPITQIVENALCASDDVAPENADRALALKARVLDLLMEQSPTIRRVYEHMAALDADVQTLRSLE